MSYIAHHDNDCMANFKSTVKSNHEMDHVESQVTMLFKSESSLLAMTIYYNGLTLTIFQKNRRVIF